MGEGGVLKRYMTNQEKKDYIIRSWSTSSGKKITEMLKRYYASLFSIPTKSDVVPVMKDCGVDIIKTAEEIFKTS